MNTQENTNTASPSAPAGAGIDWELRYTTGDTPWIKPHAHPALLDWLSKNSIAGKVLVPGCGGGHDVRAIATGGAEVLGIDIAPSAIRLAESFPQAASERYLLGDFLAGDANSYGPFDWIFEHTCLCALPPYRRQDYVNAASAALRPGGFLLAVFYSNPDNPDHAAPPFACPDSDINRFFDPYFETLESRTSIPTYPGREERETLRLYQKRDASPAAD